MQFLLRSTCLLLCLMSLTASALDASPGRWEITTRVVPPKLPWGLTIPASLALPRSGTRSLCITPHDRDAPQKLVKEQTGCELRGFTEHKDGEVAWNVTCEGPPRTRASGRFAAGRDTLAGTGTVVTDVQGFEVPFAIRYSARRVGECPGG